MHIYNYYIYLISNYIIILRVRVRSIHFCQCICAEWRDCSELCTRAFKRPAISPCCRFVDSKWPWRFAFFCAC